ncbi:MAG: zinc-ribbon domain-containing protein [Simkaniaceae bacterium]|nr:zinc-ribbon domain-containing protein [Simkaniaceae bacterium]
MTENPFHRKAYVVSRTYGGNGCPHCAKIKQATNLTRNSIAEKESLADVYPEIARMWYSTKNGAPTPNHVSHGSHKKVRWRCEKGHGSHKKIRWRCEKGHVRKTSLKRALAGLRPEWDYTLFDCSPAPGLLPLNVVVR